MSEQIHPDKFRELNERRDLLLRLAEQGCTTCKKAKESLNNDIIRLKETVVAASHVSEELRGMRVLYAIARKDLKAEETLRLTCQEEIAKLRKLLGLGPNDPRPNVVE
jgi:hypothetical protein